MKDQKSKKRKIKLVIYKKNVGKRNSILDIQVHIKATSLIILMFILF